MLLYCTFLLLILAFIVIFSKNFNVKYVVTWLLIITSIATVYGLRDEILNSKLVTVFLPYRGYVAKDGSLEFKQSSNGHFYIQAEINQKNITFLLDTGATDTVLTLKDAEKIGVNLKEIKNFKRYQTANGTVLAGSVEIPKIKIGSFVVENVRVSVNTYPMSTSLLGMNLLKHFDFTIKNDRLIIYHD
ncbi:MAG: TIGR02281 family clan AA aspartic protease [Wolbachia endosymbiont of Xenopsylla cheopis]